MSTTNFGTNDSLTVKLWGRMAFESAVKDTLFGQLMGSGADSIVQKKDELSKNAGDRVRFRLRALPSGQGVDGNSTLEGNEEGLDFQYFDLGIDAKRHASKTDLGISQQRVDFDLRSELKEQEKEWWEEYLDTMFFETLSGATGYSYHASAASFGGNSLSAPSTNRILYGGNATAKNNVDSSDTFDLSVIDRAVATAKLATPTMKPANFNGKKCWVCIVHTYQAKDLRTNTSTGQWLDIQKAAMAGGKITDNPIFSHALGMYNNTLIIESTRIPTYSDYGSGGNLPAARALFLGRQAAVVGFGRKTPNAGRMSWNEQTFDYGNKAGVGTELIWGIRKTLFGADSSSTAEDYGVIALDTYATA